MIYDVAIVGASLAGALAADVLGEAGVSVVILDKHTFPRRKACGEGLSNLGLEVLKRRNIESSIRDCPHTGYKGYEFYLGGQRSTVIPSGGGGIAIQRSVLDSLVLERALRWPSVRPRLSREVREITLNGLVRTDTEDIRARYIIVACGSQAAFLEHAVPGESTKRPNRSGISATYRGAFRKPHTWVSIFIRQGYEIYCTAVSSSLLNICVLTSSRSSSVMRNAFSSDTLVQEVFEQLGFQGVLEHPPIGRTGIGRVRRPATTGRLLLVGDACEEFDPIGGMGMTHALASGELAARAILECASAPAGEQKALLRYAGAREEMARPLRRMTGLSGQMIQASRHFPALLGLASSPFGGLFMRAALSGSSRFFSEGNIR